ncbi:hypothetical protein EAH89_13580 [Roseomonas nepalensis]|uniref:Conjugal transfer protein TraW n=1 Tax=Muricoccus nepalensis TaxID=1854500 RepID=A0A502G325_9PROT|nr:hypothetical protein [Roseomonas nepalensis]TPG55961.1 hypothetical protein EAH89_13580 [Roseomonas nepalensis]
MRNRLKSSVAVIALTGGLLVAAPRLAHAEWPTFDAITHFLIEQSQKAMTSAVDKVYDNVTNIGTLISDRLTGVGNQLNDRLGDGFTQTANYQRAQIGAVQQIADASNSSNARFYRDMRNSEIRDEHTASPQACLALDSGQSSGQSQIQGGRIVAAIADVMDARGEGAPNTPAWFGQAQSMTSSNALHLSRYCDADEAAAGLCTPSARPNADVRAISFVREVYSDGDAVNAANDFSTNVVQPVVPAALRGDQLISVEGQDAAARRRAYDARMSLSRSVFSHQIALQAPTVTLNEAQQTQLRARGVEPPAAGSWLQVLGLEVDRRFTDVAWAASLHNMTPAAVNREIAQELALSNYIALANLRLQMQSAAVGAANLAVGVERGFTGVVSMPSPTIAAN